MISSGGFLNRKNKKTINTNMQSKDTPVVSLVAPFLSPLSSESDPRVKKLKKELEKLDITPKPKYINFKFI